jgi:hypothetical protein
LLVKSRNERCKTGRLYSFFGALSPRQHYEW